jgi:hypothetical protein
LPTAHTLKIDKKIASQAILATNGLSASFTVAVQVFGCDLKGSADLPTALSSDAADSTQSRRWLAIKIQNLFLA